MYTEVPKTDYFWHSGTSDTCMNDIAKGIKPNAKTVSAYSLSLYSLEQKQKL